MSETSRSISTATGATLPSAGLLSQKRFWLIAGAVVAVACGGMILAFNYRDGDAQSLPSAKVERGPMVVSITEDGEIMAERQQVITNDLRWSVTIEYVWPEGKVVPKGKSVIRFKCDNLIDAAEEQELKSQTADNEDTAAQTNYDIKELDARVRKAKQGVKDAEADLKKYNEAIWPQERDDAEAAIQLAQRDLKLAEHRLQSKLKINADKDLNKPYSDNEIDAEKLAVQRLQLALKSAQTEKDILHKYTHPRQLRDFTIAVEDAKLEQTSAEAERSKQLKLAQTQKDYAAFNRKRQADRLTEYIEDRKTKLDVKAKESGLVVYETRRRPWHRPITVAVGENINPWQQLIIIPDADSLVVRTKVYEAVRERVDEGLPATVRLDARAGKVLRGKVSKVAALPDSQNPWLSPGVKVYPTTVTFDEPLTGLDLKPGMTCDVEIVLAELADALSVPIAAVFSEDEATHCFRLDEKGQPQRVSVKIGMTSESRAQILSGLAEGDTVLLVPPPGVQVSLRRKKPVKPTTLPAGVDNGNGGAAKPKPKPETQPATTTPSRSRPGGAGSGRGSRGRGRRPR